MRYIWPSQVGEWLQESPNLEDRILQEKTFSMEDIGIDSSDTDEATRD